MLLLAGPREKKKKKISELISGCCCWVDLVRHVKHVPIPSLYEAPPKKSALLVLGMIVADNPLS